MIAIIDYGAANLKSVATRFQKSGAEVRVTDRAEDIAAAERLVLPGVGAFDPAMRWLRQTGLADAMQEAVVRRGRPILGICLGMQLFTRMSEEGSEAGLGWIDAETRRFRFEAPPGQRPKVPHIGWNEIVFQKRHPLIEDLDESATVYFAHSYYVACRQDSDVLGLTHYGHEFASAVQIDNVIGIQFHPEKSHELGHKLIHNFLTAC